MSKSAKGKAERGRKKRARKSKARSSQANRKKSLQKVNIEAAEAAAEAEVKEEETVTEVTEEAADISVPSEKPEEETETAPEEEETESVTEEEPEAAEETQPEEESETAPEDEDTEPETEEEPEAIEGPQPEEEPEDEAEPEEEPAPEKPKRTGLKVLGALILIGLYSAAFIFGAVMLEKKVVNPDRFHKGTYVNEVDVSGMTVPEAKRALTDVWNTHDLTIIDTSGTKIGTIGDFTFEYDIDKELDQAMRPGAEKALLRFIKREDASFTIEMDPSESTDSFDRQFNELSIVKDAEGDVPSKNAYIDKSDTEFRIVKEVIGNSVDLEKLKDTIFDAIANDEDVFEYRRSSFHKPPEIVSTSPSLLKEREYCRKYLSFKIRLRNSINDYTITPEWLDKMIRVKPSGKGKIKEDGVASFISDVLYPKFSSTGDTRTLRSAGGGKYTVSGGTYGFVIDTEKEKKVITGELKEREDVEREPNYSGKRPSNKGTDDIGDDFVEVSIAKQMVWVVRDGKVKVETPVVTGNVPRHNTPTGVYYIVYKDTNATLKGHNDDGSEYESHVRYWMPFYLGYGLHDANWRGAFGGSIYIGNGSHGCVNCPPYIMPKIFELCFTGMPVIVH